MKKCPFCDEDIKPNAVKCRYCGSMLEENYSKDSIQSVATDKARITLPISWTTLIWGIIFSLILAILTLNLISNDNGWSILTFFLTLIAIGIAIMREFSCSYCRKKDQVRIFKENKECTKCKTLHIIDWK